MHSVNKALNIASDIDTVEEKIMHLKQKREYMKEQLKREMLSLSMDDMLLFGQNRGFL